MAVFLTDSRLQLKGDHRAMSSVNVVDLLDLQNFATSGKVAVLVAEDDDADYRLFGHYLERIGDLTVHETRAGSVAAAVDLLERYPFDIAFINSRLADGHGTDIIRQAGGRMSRTPLVLVTGISDSAVESEALRAGAYDYLHKDALSSELLSRVIHYVCAQHEVMRRLVAAEQRSRDMATLAEAANEAKSKFLAQMSHDLRTPLNAILAFSEVIRDQTFGPDAWERYVDYADSIHSSGKTLLALIGELLDLAKVESGEFSIAFEEIDIVSTINEAVDGIMPLATRKCLSMRTRFVEKSVIVYADPVRIGQMITNLLSNAIKFTPDGGTITAGVEIGGEDIVAYVSDTGVGIPSDALRDIGQPFFQIANPMQNPGEGTGLGLALVKSLIERHGGTMDIVSEYGEGTRVSLNFPRKLTAVVPA